MSMITATAWVPQGFAAAFPTKYAIDDEELARISKLTKLKLEDAKEDGPRPDASADENSEDEESGVKLPTSKEDDDDDLREYDLENYDIDPSQGKDLGEEEGKNLEMFGNIRAMAYHESNVDDPYITLQEDDEDDEEREELQILPTDNLVLAAKVEDEVAHLEVYVYEDEADNLYVHHDIMLPAIPLCVEWLDIAVGNTPSGQPVDQSYKGNFVAVGTFEPDIELWDLDTVDCMYPNAILGQGGEAGQDEAGPGKKKKQTKKRKTKKANDDHHVDAVLSLAANRNHRTLLASSSADKTIKLWDLSTTKCAKSYSYHTDKVCSIVWHPKETTVLLSGSYDRTVVAADMRAPDATKPRWGVESDVEMVKWNPHDPHYFFITTENGVIHYHDARAAPSGPESSKPVWKLQAHDESISAFDINPTIPGYAVTGSTDKEVKLWNIKEDGPSMIVSRNLGVGKVFSTTFGPDAGTAFRLAVAGSKGAVQIWDTSTNAAIRRAFAERVAPIEGEIRERLVAVNDESSESESESEDGGDADHDAISGAPMDED